MKKDLVKKLAGKKANVTIEKATIMADCGPMEASDNKWRTREDLDTLLRAEEIRADSGRMKLVKELAKEKKELISKI